MVALAQLVERQVVALEVVGSSPTGHPSYPVSALDGAGLLPVRETLYERVAEGIDQLAERI